MLKSSLRRSAIVLAGALLGLGGAAAVAAPASAHDSTITAKTTCNPGTGLHDIVWALTNDWGTDATVQNLKLSPGDAPVDADGNELENGVVIPMKSGKVDGVATYHQSLPARTKSATVSFDAHWSDYTDRDNTTTVDLGAPCAAPVKACVGPDDARFHHEFAVEKGRSVAKVTLDDGIDLCDGEPVTLVSYYAPRPQFSVPQFAFDSATDTIGTGHPVADLEVEVPDCNTQVDLFFGSKDDIIKEITENGPRYGDKKLGTRGLPGSRSQGPGGAYNGGSKVCQNPAVQPVSTCTGELTLNLSNDGRTAAYPIEFTVKAGDFTKTVTVNPGKGEKVTIPAGKGDAVVSYPGHDDETFAWEQPGDCALPTVLIKNTCDTVTVTAQNPKGVTPATATITYGDTSKTVTVAAGKSGSVTFKPGKGTTATVAFKGLDIKPIKATLADVDCGGSAGGGGLPVTGAAAGTIAGVAAAMLLVGGALFFVARRRRVTFTA